MIPGKSNVMYLMHVKLYQQHLWKKCRLLHKINSLSHDFLSKIMVTVLPFTMEVYRNKQNTFKYICKLTATSFIFLLLKNFNQNLFYFCFILLCK